MSKTSPFISKSTLSTICLLALIFSSRNCQAADPSVANALALKPVQRSIEFDTPSLGEQKECQVSSVKAKGRVGWVVRAKNGQMLRRFLDTNGDGKIDQWCYFQDGVEVYRDIDANFNGRADQYRWLGIAGTRWGLDSDEDGSIDRWRAISAEEVTAEIVTAIRSNDKKQFERVLVSPTELKELGLGTERHQQISQKSAAARSGFAAMASRQRLITDNSKWVHFGGTRPGLIPADTDGSTKDLLVYDNIAAIVETDGKHVQLAVGTLVQLKSGWRAIELPRTSSEELADSGGGIFFQASLASFAPDNSSANNSSVNSASLKVIAKFEAIEQQLAAAKSARELETLNDKRADILEELIAVAATDEEKMNWIRQFADTVSGSYQSGQFSKGLVRLQSLYQKLSSQKADTNSIAYVRYRYLNGQYTADLQKPNADYVKIQETWTKNIKAFVDAYPKSDDAPDAILQIAVGYEFAGQDKEAIQWFGRIVRDFPSSSLAKKAHGAQQRLQSVGKSISLIGKTLDGQSYNLANHRGKAVLIHYWATWCEPCKQEFQTLKNLQAKYGRRGFTLVGVNIDNQKSQATNYLRSQRLPWPQLFEEGGMESRLANEMGVVTLPTLMLIGKDGRVVRRNITAGEVDAELAKLLR